LSIENIAREVRGRDLKIGTGFGVVRRIARDPGDIGGRPETNSGGDTGTLGEDPSGKGSGHREQRSQATPEALGGWPQTNSSRTEGSMGEDQGWEEVD
jgi:hypothetical protein